MAVAVSRQDVSSFHRPVSGMIWRWMCFAERDFAICSPGLGSDPFAPPDVLTQAEEAGIKIWNVTSEAASLLLFLVIFVPDPTASTYHRVRERPQSTPSVTFPRQSRNRIPYSYSETSHS